MSAPAIQPPSFSSPLSRALLVCAAIYIAVWTLFPFLLGASFPLDVVESLGWGREWQWGYYKHPPLAPTVLHVFYVLFGGTGPFLLSQLCIAATLWLVWRMGCRLMAPDRALVGTVLTMGVAYYTLPAIEFNHNIAQMPIWAALGYLLLLALQEGRMRHWLLLGAVAGLGLLTKYSVGILLASFGLYILLTPARKALRTPGPWLAVVLMVMVFLPHLLWLQETDWLPFAYASSRAASITAYPRLSAFGFLGTQLVNHLPLALIVAAALWRVGRTQPRPAGQRLWSLHTAQPLFLLALAVGPGALVTLLGLTTGMRLRDMWGSPMWAFSGLLLAAWVPAAWWPVVKPRLLRGVVVWLTLITVLAASYAAFGAQWRQRPARTDWPAQALAEKANTTWQQVAHCKLNVVAGDSWLAGLIATQEAAGPSVLIHDKPSYSPWVTLPRLQAQGALWVEELDKDGRSNEGLAPPAPLDAIQAGPEMQLQQGEWLLPWRHNPQGAPLRVLWRTYVPAACAR